MTKFDEALLVSEDANKEIIAIICGDSLRPNFWIGFDFVIFTNSENLYSIHCI